MTSKEKGEHEQVVFTMPVSIEEESVYELIRTLDGLDSNDEVILYFNSIGGDLSTSMAMARVLESLPCPTTAINLGKVASGAVLPFMACKSRYAFPESYFLIHNAIISQGELSIRASYDSACYSMQMQQQYEQSLCHGLGITREELLPLLGTETYITPDEAIERKWIHAIAKGIV